ncbi:hypothetical protein TrLO_g14079 [Triparma laevis f. longispina]|uniref:Acylphosphatase-like domain-containing protein n=1 Tax=Triparma laevis f. longispina TaxID=1714387 RepID=A0A9W7F690_9STRA|nr:hypothetical protein TrLO_g14079 [Triparma laevis f. longispina]
MPSTTFTPVLLLLLLLLLPPKPTSSFHVTPNNPRTCTFARPSPSSLFSSASDETAQATLTIKGEAGGYFRARAHSEASKFRSLTGSLTFTPESHKIVVEGSKKKIEGFIRWCRKGEGMGGLYDGGQVDVEWSDFEGIWDDFYVQDSE